MLIRSLKEKKNGWLKKDQQTKGPMSCLLLETHITSVGNAVSESVSESQ